MCKCSGVRDGRGGASLVTRELIRLTIFIIFFN